MNKFELADAIVAKTGLAKKDVEHVMKTMLEVITEALTKNQEVTLTGFGTFSAKHRSARAGVNPQKPTERIQVPAVTVPKFKAGKALKDALKGKSGATEAPAPIPQAPLTQ
jgi:DNA-binding protein HU-beta